MRLMKILLSTLALMLGANGCSESVLPNVPRPQVPFVHKIDIQQGNIVDQNMVAQLRIGMNKKKVRFVMGTPIIVDTFHSNRWDYIYTYHKGGTRGMERRLITVVFNEQGKLTNLEGNVTAALGRLEVDTHQDTSVDVPGNQKRGIFNKLKDAMPFTGDDEPELAEDDDKSNDTKSMTVADGSDDEADAIQKAADEQAARMEAAEKDAITVPGGAPPKKKKGFFQRLADSVGLGADDEDLEDDTDKDDELDYDPNDPKYREQTDPSSIGGDG